MSVLKLIVIDLVNADINKFELYEKRVLPLLKRYGARLELCVRSLDNTTETHILYFPSTDAFDNFLADPVRATLQDEWKLVGAVPTVTDVGEIRYLE